jgi:hypothetical protein
MCSTKSTTYHLKQRCFKTLDETFELQKIYLSSETVLPFKNASNTMSNFGLRGCGNLLICQNLHKKNFLQKGKIVQIRDTFCG